MENVIPDDALNPWGKESQGIPESALNPWAEPEPDTILGEIPKGLKAGVQQLKGMGYGIGALASQAVGSEAGVDWAREGLKEVEAATPKPAVASYSDVTDLTSAAKYLAYGVASNVPNMALSIGGGGVGALIGGRVVSGAVKSALTKELAKKILAKGVARGAMAGAAGASIGMEAGSIAGDQLTETGEVDPLRAVAGAIPAGLLDVIPEWYLAKKLGLFGGEGRKAGEKLIKFLGRTAATQFAMEAPTEAMQSVIERASVPGKAITNQEAWDEYINAFILGGATGAVMGGGAGIFAKKQTAVQKVIERDPLANDLETQLSEADPDGLTSVPAEVWDTSRVPVRQASPEPPAPAPVLPASETNVAGATLTPEEVAVRDMQRGNVAAEEAKVKQTAAQSVLQETAKAAETQKGFASEAEALMSIQARRLDPKDFNVQKAGNRWTVTPKSIYEGLEETEETATPLRTEEAKPAVEEAKAPAEVALRKDGYEPASRIMAAELEAGDKVKINNEVFESKGIVNGKSVLKDGVTLRVAPDSDLDIEAIKRGEPVLPPTEAERQIIQETAEAQGGRLEGGWSPDMGFTVTEVRDGTKRSYQVRTPEEIAPRFAEARRQPPALTTTASAVQTASDAPKPTISPEGIQGQGSKTTKKAQITGKAIPKKNQTRIPGFVKGAQGKATKEDVQAVADNLMSGLKNVSRALVHTNVKDVNMPIDALDAMNRANGIDENGNSDVAGMVWDGQIYLFSDNISSELDVIRTFVKHEMFHKGFQTLFRNLAGKNGTFIPYLTQVNTLLDNIWTQREAGVRENTAKNQDQLEIDSKDGVTRTKARRKAAEEWLANQAPESEPKLFDRLVSIVRNFLRQIGFDVKLSDEEVRTIIADSYAALRGEVPSGIKNADPVFAFNSKSPLGKISGHARSLGARVLAGTEKKSPKVGKLKTQIAAHFAERRAKGGVIDYLKNEPKENRRVEK